MSAPGEFDYKFFGQKKLRTYWDFDWNVTANQRIQNVYLGQSGVYTAVPAGAAGPYGGATGYGFAPTGRLRLEQRPSAAAAKSGHSEAESQNLADGVAWAIGEQIGENKKKGDWSLAGEFRQMGLGSVDPNIKGTDFGNSYMNQQGIKLKGVYNFTDNLSLGVTYYNTWDYKDNGLYNDFNGGNANSKPASGTTQYLVSQSSSQRVQVDLGWKF